MAVQMDRGEILHPVEVDLLCTFAEVEPPFPLEIPSAGETGIERLVMFAGAREQLTERGLADEDGPLGVADDFVYLLHNATGVLDLVLAKEERTLGAAVLTYRDVALLITQDATDPEAMVRMKASSLDDAIDDLFRLIPSLDASLAAPFNLPRAAIANALHAMVGEEPTGNPLRSDEVDELLRAHGIDDRVARRMVAHLQPVLGNGQAGTAKRDDTEDQWRRTGSELRWLDTARGRLRLANDEEWISVNPLTPDELRTTLRRLASSIRG